MNSKKVILKFENVKKVYGKTITLNKFNLDIHEGEFLTILGPSGCGKTTLLRLIGGFTKPNDGKILLNGKDISKLEPHKRPVNTVFQNYALFSHMNVFDNIAFGLIMSKKNKLLIKEEVTKVLKLVGLNGYENRRIQKLSGGQKQRVALARAIINKPKILLLDEPLSALDKTMRINMQRELKKIHQELGITFIFVTHDQEEALSMSNRIIILNDGDIIQDGTPIDIYDEPANIFAANFIGHSNIIKNATFIKDKLVKFDGKEIKTIDKGFGKNTPVNIILRPEDIDIVKMKKGFFEGKIIDIIYKGTQYDITVKCKNREYKIETTDKPILGSKVSIKWEVEDLHVMAYEKI